MLRAECKTMAGEWIPASIDINHYITNIDGQLVWQENGSFTSSCKAELEVITSETLSYSPTLLASCHKDSSVFYFPFPFLPTPTTDNLLNLNERLVNLDGKLRYVR
ncbi:CVNH domain-containing protein [Phormidium sp. CCY1219]|nr:CVNH domain-containing protein [Phormidium sp. CCY1219]